MSGYRQKALGAVVGGAIISLVLINRLTPLEIASLLSSCILIFAVVLPLVFEPKRPGPATYLAAVFLILIVAAWPMGLIGKIEDFSNRSSWHPFRLIRSESSIYGNISVASQGSQINFYSSGLFLSSFPDKLARFARNLHRWAQIEATDGHRHLCLSVKT